MLTNRQRAFVEHYLTCWNAAEAARLAGYSERTARAIGHENLTKPEIKALIQAKLEALKMTSAETLARISDQARGSMGDFLSIRKEQRGEGEEAREVTIVCVDLAKAKELGKLHLIKKLKEGQYGVEIELYSAQAALELLGRHHGAFNDKVQVEGLSGLADFLGQGFDAATKPHP